MEKKNPLSELCEKRNSVHGKQGPNGSNYYIMQRYYKLSCNKGSIPKMSKCSTVLIQSDFYMVIHLNRGLFTFPSASEIT